MISILFITILLFIPFWIYVCLNNFEIFKKEKHDDKDEKNNNCILHIEKSIRDRWTCDQWTDELKKFSNIPFITFDNLEEYKNEIIEYLDDSTEIDMLTLPGLNYVFQTKRSFRVPYLIFEYSLNNWYRELFKYGILNLKNLEVRKLCKKTYYTIKEAKKIQKEVLENYMKKINTNEE